MANQRTSGKARSRTESRKPGGRLSRPRTKGSGQRARQAMKGLKARIDFARELFDWASHAPALPPQTSARTLNEVLADICAKLAKISACASMESAVEGITDHMVLYGDKMSKEEAANLEKQRGKLMGGMKNLGC